MTKKKDEAPIIEEKLVILSETYGQSDFCSHRNQKGEYTFLANGDRTITCTECGRTFTTIGNYVDTYTACNNVCRLRFITQVSDMQRARFVSQNVPPGKPGRRIPNPKKKEVLI